MEAESRESERRMKNRVLEEVERGNLRKKWKMKNPADTKVGSLNSNHSVGTFWDSIDLARSAFRASVVR